MERAPRSFLHGVDMPTVRSRGSGVSGPEHQCRTHRLDRQRTAEQDETRRGAILRRRAAPPDSRRAFFYSARIARLHGHGLGCLQGRIRARLWRTSSISEILAGDNGCCLPAQISTKATTFQAGDPPSLCISQFGYGRSTANIAARLRDRPPVNGLRIRGCLRPLRSRNLSPPERRRPGDRFLRLIRDHGRREGVGSTSRPSPRPSRTPFVRLGMRAGSMVAPIWEGM